MKVSNSHIAELNARWTHLASDLTVAIQRQFELSNQVIDTGDDLRSARTEHLIRPTADTKTVLDSLMAEQLALNQQVKQLRLVIGDLETALPILRDEIDRNQVLQAKESTARLAPIAKELIPEAEHAFMMAAAQLCVLKGILVGAPSSSVLPENVLRPHIRRSIPFSSAMDEFGVWLRAEYELDGDITI